MAIKQIRYLNFKAKTSPELLELLNVIAPLEFMSPHSLAQKIMLQELRDLKRQYDKISDSAQSAAVAV